MVKSSIQINEQVVVEKDELQQLFNLLGKRGYSLIGPVARDGAIVYDEIASVSELPSGWTDEQDGGQYRLKKRNDNALFGYVVGPQSWKKYLFPPITKLWEAKKVTGGFQPIQDNGISPKMAFIGVRACELKAIAIHDKVLTEGEYKDPLYQARRGNIFILAVNCTQAGGTCFCTSMKTGPKVGAGFDLAMTEILEKNSHYFVMEAGSETGLEMLSQLSFKPADAEVKGSAEKAISKAAGKMGRTIDTNNIKEMLYRNLEHPRWEEVAKRCLNCANCTMVCPTCFCMSIDDYTDLGGQSAERRRRWDSCFNVEYSYIHGGSIRPSGLARYRQWMTHKLASWIDQFGTSGCVGCGRCITWCPVGIDLTEEARAIRESAVAGKISDK
jgi:sulfhydrogenase subunit beta (sulfur reductase)